jgi:phosphate-selective porin OprO/OprP
MITGLRTVNRYVLAGASAIGILAFGSPEAKAASDVQQLEAAMRAMQAQMRDLQRQVGEAKAAAAAAKASGGGGTGDDLDLKVRWRGAPELSSKDGKFKMKARGRFQADYNAIDQDRSITGRPNVSAAEIRRARLGIEGVVFYDVEYKLEVDFANDEVALKDAYLAYTGLADGLSVLFGNFKTPNSIEEMTSSRFYTFMERSAFVETFGLDRQIGAGATYAQKHFTLSAGVFGPLPETTTWMKDVKTGAARVTLAPINNDTSVVHLGASWRERRGAEDLRSDPVPKEDQFFRYRARGADLHLADRFISTPQIFDRDTFWGVEGAVIWKSLYAVGEYTQLKADMAPGFIGAYPTYVGWYIEAGWFITGEMRTYDEGEFGRTKVKNPVFGGSRGWGAWQLAGKYDVIDLTDKATAIAACSMCGEQATWLIGVNWYLNDYTRMQFNYNVSDIEGGFLDGANRNNGAMIKGFGMRAQVDW